MSVRETDWSVHFGQRRRRQGISERSSEANKEVAQKMTVEAVNVGNHKLLVLVLIQLQGLRISCEESGKRRCSSVVQPIDAYRCVVHIGGLPRTVEVLRQINVDVFESPRS